MFLKLIKHFLIAAVFVFMNSYTCRAQLVKFYPEIDSIIIVGTDIPPFVVFKSSEYESIKDTIFILTGSNRMYSSYPLTQNYRVSNCCFIINDSLKQYDCTFSIKHYSHPEHSIDSAELNIAHYIDQGFCSIVLYVCTNDSIVDSSSVKFYSVMTGLFVDDLLDASILSNMKLSQNYPNPFNASTVISYKLTVKSKIVLRIYDILGRETAVLVDEIKSAGMYTVKWDASGYPSGVYFYRLSVVPATQRDRVQSDSRKGQAGNFADTKKLVLMR